MGLPVEVNNLMMGSLGGYTVGRSLRFRNSASAYLNRTPASAPTSSSIFTFSAWVKRGQLVSSGVRPLFGGNNGGSNIDGIQFWNDRIDIFFASGASYRVTTTAVFRDPSAWYHIVIAVDTTQATASNRVKIYVNGVQITTFDTANYPVQNYTFVVFNKQSIANYIGWENYTAGAQFDGYLAELNMIDGQALTPSSFGAYDTNGVWQPKKYTGTYGTNGFYLPFLMNSAYSAAISGTGSTVNVNGSYTSLTLGTGDFTIEGWVYLNSTSSVGVVDWRPASTNGNYPVIYISGGVPYYYVNSANVITGGSSIPTATWTHIAVARSGTTTKMFINGTQSGSSWTDNTNYLGATNRPGFAGTGFNGTANGFDGYFSNLRIVKGTAVYTANFTVPTSPLTAITNTSLLTFNSASIVDNSGNSVALTVGGTSQSVQFAPFNYNFNSDQSGNGNNWTPNNISLTAGTTYDSMIDSPTVSASASNYCTWNPTWKDSTLTISDGNLKVSSASNSNGLSTGTIAVSSGKWYWEATIGGSVSLWAVGIIKTSVATPNYTSLTSGSSYAWNNASTKYNGQTGTSYGATYTTGDVLGVALDLDGGTITFYKNNVSQGTAFTGISGTFTPMSLMNASSDVSTNFGQRPFSYTPPTGFNALNTYNLPAPSIANGAQYMAATTYTGNGTSQSITNGGNNTIGTTFQPDLVWAKIRSTTGNHSVYDSVRGAQQWISTNLTNAEGTYPGVTAFNSNGFSVGSDGGVNQNAATFVAWQWKAGGTGVTNNSGTITSTVSASPSSGFSIATYTGTGANATVGHGLGVAPSMVIVKQRSGANGWPVYHVSQTSAAYYMLLNQTDASNIAATVWNSTAPTSSVFSIGTAVGVNTSGQTYVAYCFSAVSGYSAFGKYTGNGSADGPFIFTGFRPRWVMIKNTQDATTNWYIYDTSRDTYNIASSYLMSNLSNAEASFSAFDILSNGFKIRTSNLNFNNSGQTHIYVAFAESPFKYSRAR
jgi:hypothetical protein